jgi:NAD(P)-dependent dehydrogenase (short-subunit alcohol dehydrogenase family)
MDAATSSAIAGLQREANYDRSDTSDTVAAKFASQIAGKTGQVEECYLSFAVSNNIIVIITGISPHGLGADAARAIYKFNPKLLILASRTTANVQAVITAMGSQGSGRIEALLLDLASPKSVRMAAEKVSKLTSVVDVLINNAAVMMVPEYETTEYGAEMHFSINHLGHFLFTNLLIPALLKSTDGARVINVSAAAHRAMPVNFEDPNFEVSPHHMVHNYI